MFLTLFSCLLPSLKQDSGAQRLKLLSTVKTKTWEPKISQNLCKQLRVARDDAEDLRICETITLKKSQNRIRVALALGVGADVPPD
ncbi:hypothetical protein F2Q69_00037063 [Brassica cretica]|uniref:Uncharacterized protein n=1 Tax=Brassica cretica TaxID=69181 RepID=A0A8S9SLI5_BRACR|nr:hypothetical protein F2Q69_00037063 [Brassica cretica]